MLKTVNMYNEKGNVKVTVRNAVRDNAKPAILDALGTLGRDVIVGTDGAFYVPLAYDENGGTIYARLDMTVSVKDPTTPLKEKAVKPVEVVEVDLF